MFLRYNIKVLLNNLRTTICQSLSVMLYMK